MSYPAATESAEEKGTPVVETPQSLSETLHERSHGRAHGWWDAAKNVILAKAPLEGAPLVYGGHREAEEPSDKKLGVGTVLSKFARFFGPGMIIVVAYLDPDNFQSSVEDGQDTGYLMICIMWFSLVVAIYLQYLCMRMATVTGLNLAQMNHKHMPRWLELVVYVVAETCCISTDISAVLGAAYAWNLLIPRLPLEAACTITVADSLIVLFFYSPTGTLRSIRYFELFMAGLVLAITISTAIALAQVQPSAPAGPVFRGFIPSREIFVNEGLYDTVGTIGGMLMPHALYVGSAIATPRLLEYDTKHHLTTFIQGEAPLEVFYRPSLRAIKSTIRYATWELVLTIFVIGFFVNIAPEIMSATAFDDDFDDLYELYAMFQNSINQVAATAFTVAMLFSGIAAGIVSTIAGQTVMEGAFAIKINPFARRLATRLLAIIPALIVCVSVGSEGIGNALSACNYILAITLIFVLLPVVWYTTHDKYMTVPNDDGTGVVSMKIGPISTFFAWAAWLLIIVTDIATLALLGLGLAD